MDNHFIITSFFNYVSVVCLYCLLSTTLTYTTNCTSTEREALVTFKRGLSDPSARLSSWVGDNCCKWPGITCDVVSEKVTKIDLRNSLGSSIFRFVEYGDEERPWIDPHIFSQEYKKTCLGGEVSASLLELKYLNFLDLSMNNFEGAPIPYFFGMLKSLRYLNLFSANFGGKIPIHLGNLSNLNYLDLSHNRGLTLYVENLQWLSGLSSLEYLNLGHVNLSSVQANWIHAVNGLSSLSELHLSNCGISRVDSSAAFLNLTSLEVLDLSFNDINSSIPLWLSNLTSLSTLDLSDNLFQGTIPQDFLKLENLQHLDLSWNRLTNFIEGGHTTSFSQNLCKLRFLHLACNRFEVKLEEFLDSFSNCSRNSLEYLDLASNAVVGVIPNSLGIFKNLRWLNISFNHLWGSLPNSIGNLSLLHDLRISSNQLTGAIPSSFGQLSKLVLFENGMSSWNTTITEVHLVNLTKLEVLEVDIKKKQALVFNIPNDWIPPFRLKILYLENCLIGPRFPFWLQIQTQLTGVTLSNVGISCSIPNGWISKVSSQIISLDFSNNLLKEELSSMLASQKKPVGLRENLLNDSTPLRFPNLRYLNLGNNQISGPIPLNINDLMPNLYELDLSKNYLNDSISLRFPNLRYLNLGNNQFSGPIPLNINDLMPNLYELDLSNNYLNDSISLRFPNLRYLNLRNNQFSGPIPLNINDLMPNLYELDFSKNYLNGTIPSSIKTMNQLSVLSMSDNQLSGELFDDWSTLKSLCIIDLANNDLYGKIPNTIASLTFLNKLILSNNNLHGEIPNSLQNCSLLTSIDLSENRLLQGSLPSWIGVVVSGLRLVNLRSNRFNGTIPREWCNLPFLRILDLSNNHLSGEVPSCLYNWTYLTGNGHNYDFAWRYGFISNMTNPRYFKENARLVVKGTKSEYNTILSLVQAIDLSSNKLSGEIPKEITKLVLLGTLNLSNNEFVGPIPESIGAMTQLETLDLSCNNLCGRIPESLASLDFLSHLNMSFNNLTGRIPTSNHLQTLEDPSIYEGNPWLCGSPLQTKCPGDESSNIVPISTSEEHDKENDSEMLSFYVGMGIGFPVGLIILFVIIFTNKARTIFYLHFVDRVSSNILKTIGVRRMI